MPRITAAARAQYFDTLAWYLAPERGRLQAARNLSAAYDEAMALIDAHPASGSPHPPRYPKLVEYGFRWRKIHRYWFAWTSEADGQATVTNIVFETILDGPISAEREPATEA